MDQDELERLLDMLNLPSIHQIFSTILKDSFYASLIGGWCDHARYKNVFCVVDDAMNSFEPDERSFLFYTPVQYELTGLPYSLESLFESCIKTVCARCSTVPV